MEDVLEKDLQQLTQKALALGASAAKIVDVKSVKTGSWTRWKCQYGCPNYGKTLCCPPYSPDYEATQRFLSEYQKGIIVQYTIEVEATGADDFEQADLRLSNELLRILLELEREAFLLNHYKAFSLKAGRCRLCEKCNLQHCVNPTKARPSLEACGIDVFALARDNGFAMNVVTGPITKLDIYGMVLVE